MATPLPEDQLADIKAALFRGRKIEAIRRYREHTGMGLAEAKDAVEKLEAELRSTSPHEFAAGVTESGRGCLGMVLAISALLAAIVLWRIAM
jgi:ribosomal protein L7/L12